MFETMVDRAERLARARAEARRSALAAAIACELPRGIKAEATAGGVRLTGRGLRRRFALEPRLRQLVAELVR